MHARWQSRQFHEYCYARKVQTKVWSMLKLKEEVTLKGDSDKGTVESVKEGTVDGILEGTIDGSS